MEKKKFLVLGDSNSIFIKQYIQSVLLNNYQVVLLQEGYLSDYYKQYYVNNGVQVESLWCSTNSWLRRIPVLRSSIGAWLWAKYIVRKYEHFAVVNVHGLSRNRCNIAMYLKPYSEQVILSVWGSDLLRRSKAETKQYKKYYKVATKVTLANDNIKKTLLNTYGDFLNNKCFVAGVPWGMMDVIDEIKGNSNREELCKELGINPTGLINVFLGYNGRECQRHVELTEAMSKLPKQVKEKINLVYTMTYGVPPQPYLDNLKLLAEKSGCFCTFIEKYLTEVDIAKLRLTCDILVHAQPTDAASASFYESMYAGAVCVNGSWLPYDFLTDYHNRVVEYDDICQLTVVVQDIVENFDYYKKKFARNVGFRDGKPTLKEQSKEWLKIINK